MEVIPVEQPEWLHPYTAIAGEPPQGGFVLDQTARDLLRHRALGQASSVVAAIDHWDPRDPDRLPEFLITVGRETDGNAPKRVANMLRAFQRYLKKLSELPERSGPGVSALDPMPVHRDDGWSLTSPALLAIQAILYSHEQWFRPAHHEAHSALSAYDRLDRLGPPLIERDRCFVAALIAHQTLLRVAWREDASAPREVSAFDGLSLTENYAGAGIPEDEARIACGIARTLFPFVDRFEAGGVNGACRLRSWLAAALALGSFCLQHRHHRGAEAWSPEIEQQALRFADLIATSHEEKGAGLSTLVFWQYGRLVMRHQKGEPWKDFCRQVVETAQSATMSEPLNLTYCFDRNASRKPWVRWPPRMGEPRRFRLDEAAAGGEGDQERQNLIRNIEDTVGATSDISLVGAQLTLPALGLEAEGSCSEAIEAWLRGEAPFLETFWALIEVLQERHLDYGRLLTRNFPEGPDAFKHGYFPVPLVSHVLRELHRVAPAAFSLLKLRPKDLPSEVEDVPFVSRPLSVFLPRDSEVFREGSDDSRRAKWLIARYVAAMVMNLLVTLAPKKVELDFFSEEVRHSWMEWIEQALQENAHTAILGYIMQYRSQLCRTTVTETLEGVLEAASVFPDASAMSGYILGVDIGATGIKLHRVKMVRTEAGRLDLEMGRAAGEPWEIPTDTSGRYRDAKTFAARIFSLIRRRHPEWLTDSVSAIGIAWPGAVRDSMVKASSGILGKFEGFDGRSSDDVRKIHELGVCEAFREQYLEQARKAGGEAGQAAAPPVVVLLNDGDADIKSTENLHAENGDRAQGVSIILKAGTGTACGLYVDGRQVELLAEVGKIVINLGNPGEIPPMLPGGPVQEKRFPEGLLNRYFSKKTLPAIAEALGWRVPEKTPPLDSREIGYFIAGRPDSMKSRIAQDLIYQQLNRLVDSPDDIKPTLAAVRLYYPWEDRLEKVTAERIRQLEEGVPQGWETADELALHCAEIAGKQLADAIALLVEIFRCREVRLGGGPLTGATGEAITDQAAASLRDVYAFEVEQGGSRASTGTDPHPLSEERGLRLHGPRQAEAGGLPTGPLGAARAALHAYVRETKRKALARERSRIESAPPGSVFGQEEPIERVLTREDVIRLIEAFATDLRLRTRGDGTYEKI